jgi:mono/diheme cytochrome c family protein
MGVLTYKGATAKEALGSELLEHVNDWAEEEGFADNQEAVEGARLFAVSGCLNCHVYNGDGGQNLGAPELSDIGSLNKGIQYQIDHLKCPACVNPGSPMPSFSGLGEERLQKLAAFLEASKAPE